MRFWVLKFKSPCKNKSARAFVSNYLFFINIASKIGFVKINYDFFLFNFV